jgi:hypothetical protein
VQIPISDKDAWLRDVLGVDIGSVLADDAGATDAVSAPAEAPAGGRVTVTLVIINQTEIALGFAGARYNPATLFPQNGNPNAVPANDEVSIPVDFDPNDENGQPVERSYFIDFTGTTAEGTAVKLETGFVYANGAAIPQQSTDGPNAATASVSGDTVTITYAATVPLPDSPPEQPEPVKPPADKLTTVTLLIVNQTEIVLRFAGARYNPAAMFPQNGNPNAVAANDQVSMPVDFDPNDENGQPVERHYFIDFTGTTAEGTAVKLATGFVYANGAAIPQQSTDGPNAATASVSGDTVTITYAPPASAEPDPSQSDMS